MQGFEFYCQNSSNQIIAEQCFLQNATTPPPPSSVNVSTNFTESLAAFRLPPNITQNVSGGSCVISGSLPESNVSSTISDEILTCSTPEYSSSGVWCGLVRFLSSDCTGSPVWERFDMLVGSCQVTLAGTYWSILNLNGTYLRCAPNNIRRAVRPPTIAQRPIGQVRRRLAAAAAAAAVAVTRRTAGTPRATSTACRRRCRRRRANPRRWPRRCAPASPSARRGRPPPATHQPSSLGFPPPPLSIPRSPLHPTNLRPRRSLAPASFPLAGSPPTATRARPLGAAARPNGSSFDLAAARAGPLLGLGLSRPARGRRLGHGPSPS